VTERVVVMAGALNADLCLRVGRLPAPGETVAGRDPEILPGGKASNQAVAAARLGGQVRLVGAVGDDENGRMLRAQATAAGVDVGYVRVLSRAATGQAIIAVDDDGENTIILVPGANGAIEPAGIPAGAFADAAVVCLSLEVPLPVVQRAADLAAAAGATVVLNPSPFQPLPDSLLAAVDVLIVNQVEAAQLTGTGETGGQASVTALRTALAPHGITRFVVTRGAAGSLVSDGGARAGIPATPARAIDTTGAGDAFTGALAVELARGNSLADAAARASVVAAFSTTRRGAQPSYPTLAELDQG
jgi:ribokinase